MGEQAVPDGWQGSPPAEGTRRHLLLQVVERAAPAVEALPVVDAIEEALLAIAPADPVEPAPQSPASNSEWLLDALSKRLRNVSDRERGELLELSAPAAGVSGRLIADASDKLAGFPKDARAASLILAAIGIVDDAHVGLGGE